MSAFAFHSTRAVYAGPGLATRPPAAVTAPLGRRVLVVIDPTIRRLGLADALIADLARGGADVSVFGRVMADPPEENVQDAVAMAADLPATGIVGFGGGSALDVAKIVSLVVGSGQAIGEVYGLHVATGPRLPLLLIPTTAGTGSEVSPVAVVTAGHAKKGVVSHHLLPDATILDAELTIGLPPAITAATGLDAMVHAIESFASASPNRSPISQGLAKQALALLGQNLPRAVADGRDLQAREFMLLGSHLAGKAFANAPVAAVHALAYPIGGRFHLAHGVSIALVLPGVLRFNLPDAAADYAAIAADAFPDLASVHHSERAPALIEHLIALIKAVGLPGTLQAAGIPEESLDGMADDAMQQAFLLQNNPRRVAREDALRIYQEAYS